MLKVTQAANAEQKLELISTCHLPPVGPAVWEPALACVALISICLSASVVPLHIVAEAPVAWAP